MAKLTRRVWLGSTFGPLLYGLSGCGRPASSPEASGVGTAVFPAPRSGPVKAPGTSGYYLVGSPKEATIATAINEKGWVCGAMSALVDIPDGATVRRSHAALWRVDGRDCLDLSPDGCLWSCAHGLNRHGHVVGEFQVGAGPDLAGFLWPNRPDEPPETWRWESLVDRGCKETHALAINDEGEIAGYATRVNSRVRGLIRGRDQGSANELGPIGEFQDSQALALSATGAAAGSCYTGPISQACLWPADRAPRLLLPSPEHRVKGVCTIALAVNAGGQAAGCYWNQSDMVRHACLWSGEEFRDIHSPNLGVASEATGINQGGQIVGCYTTNKGERRAFVHDGEHMLDLTGLVQKAEGLVLIRPRMIDDRGWIVGLAKRGKSPEPVAFVVRPA